MIPGLVGCFDVVPTTVGFFGFAPSEEEAAELLFQAGGRRYIFPGGIRVYQCEADARAYIYDAEGRGYIFEADERLYSQLAEDRLYVFIARSSDAMPISGFEKYPSESFNITISFTPRIPPGRTLEQTGSVVRAMNQADGTDDADSVLSGYDPPTISDDNATVTVKAGTKGDRYELQFQIALDTGGPIEERLMMDIIG